MTSPVIAVLNENPCPILLPCHRVVESNDNIGTYVSNIEKKEFLLNLEKSNYNM